MGKKDNIFGRKLTTIKPFSFDQEVAAVFDDMIHRSIPFYDEVQQIFLDILSVFFKDADQIYDLGCSTGSSLLMAHEHLKKYFPNLNFSLVGIDNSRPMLDRCEVKFKTHNVTNYTLLNQDLNEIPFDSMGVALMNYTLQFIGPKKRPALLKKIHQALRPGGILILTEKIKNPDPFMENLFVDLYYDFKRRNGYSELEISQKKEALEKVLVTLTPQEQITQLQDSGFEKVEILFKRYNFCCYLGIKQ
jgi:tRNA (cmo5U34)-methyltransferase